MQIKKMKDDIDVGLYFDKICEISNLFQDLDKTKIYKKCTRKDTYANIVFNILTSDSFNKTLLRVISADVIEKEKLQVKQKQEYLDLKGKYTFNEKTDYEKFEPVKENLLKRFSEQSKKLKNTLLDLHKDDKRAVRMALQLSVFPLSFVLESLNDEQVAKVRHQFKISLRYILEYQKHRYNIIYLLKYLNEIVFTWEFNFNKQYEYNLLGKINDKVLFTHFHISKTLIGSILLTFLQYKTFSSVFSNITKQMKSKDKENKTYDFLASFKEITKTVNYISKGLSEHNRIYEEKTNKNSLSIFIYSFTDSHERNVLFIVEKMIDGLHNEESNIYEVVSKKINDSDKVLEIISKFSKKNLSAFSKKNKESNDWSNKIFLTTVKTLSILKEIKDSKEDKWKFTVFLKEFSIWTQEINKILNKYKIEDDWWKIEKLLIQENSLIEWKSTFITPTEQPFISNKDDKSKDILQNIIKVILAMLNTAGGHILVGVIENPKSIKRDFIKNHLLRKNEYTFFNIDYELEKKKTDMDSIKLMIHDKLSSLTGLTSEKFNNLWKIEPIEIRTDDNYCKIYKIDVFKSKENIYITKNENKGITLLKRADGKTIFVDPREYLI